MFNGIKTSTGSAYANLAVVVWDELIATHLGAGSMGAALNSASSIGDPWSTVLPGIYGAGTAGNIMGNRIDAAITSRMATYTQPTGFLAATFPSGTVANTTNITAGTIATVSGNVNGSVNSVTTDVGITQAGADKAWSTAARVLTAGTNIVLAKGTGVTGFNDIAATAVVSSGAITTSGGAVTTVTNLTNLPTIPGNWLTAAGISASALNGKGDWSSSAEISSVQSDATNIKTRLPAALTGDGNMKVDILAINGSTAAATTNGILNGATVVYNGTVTGAATTTTLIDSGLTQNDTDWWKGRIIIFTSVIPMQATNITAFDPALDKLTFSTTTQAPTGATYVIV